MAQDKYFRGDNWRVGWIRETAIRNVGQGVDTANAVGDTYFHLPIQMNAADSPQPIIYNKQGRYYRRIQASQFFSYLALGVMEEGMIELTGKFIDFSWMYFLFKSTTTTGASDPYTHTFTTTSYTQKGNATGEVVPTIGMIFDFTNADSGESIYPLLLGCAVTYAKGGSQDIRGETDFTWRIKFCKAILGNNLTTWPTYPVKRAHRLDRTILALTKGGSAYAGYGNGWEFEWDDHTVLHRWSNHQYPEDIINGNPEGYFTIWWAPQEKALFTDLAGTPLDPDTDSDLDASAKAYRHATNDFSSFAIEKAWTVEYQSEWLSVENIEILMYKIKFIFKPTLYESGGKITVIDTNADDNTKYEGS